VAPPYLVTSEGAERLHRLEARVARAKRVLRQTEDPWTALRELGILAEVKVREVKVRDGGVERTVRVTSGPRGRRGRSDQELRRIAGLHENMMTAPPGRPRYSRTERLDLLLEEAAQWVAYQGDRGPRPEDNPEAFFVPDCDVPMTKLDADRNLAAYLGMRSVKSALAVLRKARALR
jgi:hypothetical protein